MQRLLRFLPLFGLLTVLLMGAFGPAQAQDPNPVYDPVQLLVPEVISVRPHDPTAYTQGLVLHNGSLYESTGGNNDTISTLREVDPQTGEVLRLIELPAEYYGEGLALIDNRLIQITWKDEVAFVYDVETFEQVGTFSYTGEGWGLCSDGRYVYQSDGSPFIELRDPQTFELIFSGVVTYQGQALSNFTVQERSLGSINELECAGDYIYANIWHTDYILQIDKTNGVVVGIVDASNLIPAEELEPYGPEAVLNGIAYDAETDTFLLTGKYWPKLFEVKFVPKE